MEFPIPNETATEQSRRLKTVLRKTLEENLGITIKARKGRTKSLPLEFVVQTRPFSVNKMSGVRKTYETKEYLEFRELIARVAGGTYGFTGKEKLRLIVHAGFSNKRGDLDNVFKPLLDSMVGCMDDVFDDHQIYEIQSRKRITKKGHEYLWVRVEVIEESEYNDWWDGGY